MSQNGYTFTECDLDVRDCPVSEHNLTMGLSGKHMHTYDMYNIYVYQ